MFWVWAVILIAVGLLLRKIFTHQIPVAHGPAGIPAMVRVLIPPPQVRRPQDDFKPVDRIWWKYWVERLAESEN